MIYRRLTIEGTGENLHRNLKPQVERNKFTFWKKLISVFLLPFIIRHDQLKNIQFSIRFRCFVYLIGL